MLAVGPLQGRSRLHRRLQKLLHSCARLGTQRPELPMRWPLLVRTPMRQQSILKQGLHGSGRSIYKLWSRLRVLCCLCFEPGRRGDVRAQMRLAREQQWMLIPQLSITQLRAIARGHHRFGGLAWVAQTHPHQPLAKKVQLLQLVMRRAGKPSITKFQRSNP